MKIDEMSKLITKHHVFYLGKNESYSCLKSAEMSTEVERRRNRIRIPNLAR